MQLFLLPVYGNISIYVTGQNYIQVKIIQRRLVLNLFPLFPSPNYSWIRTEYKENLDLTKLGQIKINLKPNLTCNIYISYKKTPYLRACIKICFCVNY